MIRSASTPLPACATTSTPPSWPSRKQSSSRASCSSSTTTARSGSVWSMSGGDPCRHDQLRDHDSCAGPLPRDAVELKLVVGAVDHLQPLVDVAQTDARAGL